MEKIDQRKYEKSRLGESEGGGRVLCICMEKREKRRLELVPEAGASQRLLPGLALLEKVLVLRTTAGRWSSGEICIWQYSLLPHAIHDTVSLISPANPF